MTRRRASSASVPPSPHAWFLAVGGVLGLLLPAVGFLLVLSLGGNM
jgi:hypothetical protein